MLRNISRRSLLAGLGAMAATGEAFAGAPARSLRPHLRGQKDRLPYFERPEDLLETAGISGDLAWSVADVKSGLILESVQGSTGLPPASVAKALTTLYALETLGPDYRFKTQVLARGKLENGVLTGDLVLRGGGDPTLTTDALARLAADLKKQGLREVRGEFIVDDTALPYTRSIDEGQPDQVGYSPAVSGIALNFNRVHFEWKAVSGGYNVTMDARTERYRPDVQMAVMKVVDRSLPVYTYADSDGKDSWTVARGALGKGGARWLPVRRPGAYAGDVFRTLARANGIVLSPARIAGIGAEGAEVLAENSSTPLSLLLRNMLKYSNNLTAEMIGMTASARLLGKPPASMKASAEQMSRWASERFGMKNTMLEDHSGLGDDSRMTPEDLVGALVEARRTGILLPLLKSIPVLDSKGRLVKSSPIKIQAKTGTLNFVSGLGGFITAADGTELAFAIFAADSKIRAGLSREERERPRGARHWNGRARMFQQKLIARWGALYGSS